MSYLRLEGITKRFDRFVANDRISLTVEAGSIHALLGENGAGKSTLMNILSGLYQPDEGQIYLEDQPIAISSPHAAANYGIGMIHQHFMLVPRLTVTENIILGTPGSFRLDLPTKAAEIATMSRDYGLEVPPLAKIADLAVGIQQRVEILKILYRRAKILILDEPTAVLTPPEISAFLQILRQLAADHHTIIFITHKLDEVMAVCDAVTILRRGQAIATLPTAATTRQELARMMVDREVAINQRPSAKAQGEQVLEVQNLWVRDDRGLMAVRDLSFQLHAGEILGIAGVDGNGQRELADAIAGLMPSAQSSIRVAGAVAQRSKSSQPKIGYIPEDRQRQGLILSFTIARNLILKAFQKLPFCRNFLLQTQAINDHAEAAIAQFDIRGNSKLKAQQLSGGNQQKIILARELDGEPALIIAMQPARGLDIGATESVQQALLAQRERGAAILYISTELEEVMAMGDRIAVMYAGQFLDILEGETATIDRVGWLMAGGGTA